MRALLTYLKSAKVVGSAAFVILVLFACYMKGRMDEREICAERLNVERAAHFKKAMEEQQKAVHAATEWGKQIGKQKVVIKTVVKEVEKFIQSGAPDPVCLTDDGVRLVNSAIGAGDRDTSGDIRTLPVPSTSSRWAGKHDLNSPGGHLREIPLLPSEARSPVVLVQSSTASRDNGSSPTYRFHSTNAVGSAGTE